MKLAPSGPSHLVIEPDWQDQAACAEADPELWHPTRGTGADLRMAKKICGTCPVRLPCLEAGMGQHGIWGGTTEMERRALRRHGLA